MVVALVPDQAIFDNIFCKNWGSLYGRPSGMHKIVHTTWTASYAEDLPNLQSLLYRASFGSCS